MKLKRLVALLLAGILALGVLFVTGCSEDEVDALVSVASEVLSETDEDEAQTSLPAQETTEQATEKTTTQAVTDAETTTEEETETPSEEEPETAPPIDEQIPEDGEYLSMEQVSVYIHIYGHLPNNYLTKKEARKLGWVASEGNLWDVAPGCAIGGDRFENREKLLPNQKGRKYYECDVNYEGGPRGAERIVFSNDGLVYYTDNHYEDFMLLFDGED